MRLLFSPGACSLSVHIALREAGLPFELVRVDLRTKKTEAGADFLAINPKGYVPALELADGEVGMSPINNPKAGPELKQALRERLDARLAYLVRHLEDRPFLLGDQFTVADGYAFYVLRSLRRLGSPAFDASAVLSGYTQRIGARPAVRDALAVEGLS